jgi:hypothetical protein
MNNDYIELTSLRDDPRYKRLQGLWMQRVTEIEAKRDSAAGRGAESAWRYFAGQEKGYKAAMMEIDLAVLQLETENENVKGETSYDALLDEIRGTKK